MSDFWTVIIALDTTLEENGKFAGAAPGGFLRFTETSQVRSRHSNRAVSTVFREIA